MLFAKGGGGMNRLLFSFESFINALAALSKIHTGLNFEKVPFFINPISKSILTEKF